MSAEGTSAAAPAPAPWTVKRVLDWTVGYLKEHGSETPRLDAEVLLAHVRGCPRIKLYTDFHVPLSEEQRARMRELVKRRAASEPVAYLVGYREFFSLKFHVTPDVFIPRPDTETLVIAALDAAKQMTVPVRILDLCTGSGCVAVAIAANCPAAEVTAVELNPKSLEVARRNVLEHGLAERLTLLEGDLYAPLSGLGPFEVIVSNPPYIAAPEVPALQPDVRHHEPRLALDGGPRGLDVISRIIARGREFLSPRGWLMVELSPEQAPATMSQMRQHGYADVGTREDLSGQCRVVSGRSGDDGRE